MRSALILTLAVATLAACGPKPNAGRVKNLPDLTSTLTSRGVPNASWTDAELDSYHRQLIIVESMDRGANAGTIGRLKGHLAAARAVKASESAKQVVRDVNETTRATQVAILARLIKSHNESMESFEKNYLNNPNSKESDMPAALLELDKLIALNLAIQNSPVLPAEAKQEFLAGETRLRDLRATLSKPAVETKAD